MGPELVLGAFAWLGIALFGVLLVAMLKHPRLRFYIGLAVLPGVALAVQGVQGQVGAGRIAGLSFMFFLVGTVLVGGPLAGLLWWWRNRGI